MELPQYIMMIKRKINQKSMGDSILPSKEAILEAKKNPNGWVYVIDSAFENEEDIPPQAILGAWKVNEIGEIVGEFIKNENYIDLKKM